MPNITQDVKYRESMVKYALQNGVTKTAIKYRVNRKFVYTWINRYDGSLESLKYRSKKPKSNKNAHTPEEIEKIQNLIRRNPHIGLQDLWCRLKQNGYTRSISGLHKVLGRLNISLPGQQEKKNKYIAKPYEQMTFPGEKVQIDVKVVPQKCLVGLAPNLKFYQYTAIDEFTRLRYLEGFKEQSTYSSTQFLEHVVGFFKRKNIQILQVQTDNGSEFTNRFTSKRGIVSLFEKKLQELNITHHLIKPYTPRHNGKVERSHREDQKRLYDRAKFHSFQDFQTQLKRYQTKSNNRPMKPLKYLSPLEFLDYFQKKANKKV